MVIDDDPAGDWTAPGVFRCAPGVYRIPLPLPNDGLRAVNVYAVSDGDGVTVIDSGWAIDGARELLADALAQLGAGLGDVRRFLITHAHRDHYTLAVRLRDEFGMRIALGVGERDSLAAAADPDRPADLHRLALLAAGATDLVRRLRELGSSRPDPTVWQQPDTWLTDGTRIRVGAEGDERTLTAVATPGHTHGHLVFADDTPGAALLFAGDHVLPRITPSIGLEVVRRPDPLGDYLDSLELVRNRPDAVLLPAHGPVGMRVHERVDELLAHHGKRLDATLAAVADGRATAVAVANALTWTRREHRLSDLDPFNEMLAVLETAAHLQVLVERGAVTATVVVTDADGELVGVPHYSI